MGDITEEEKELVALLLEKVPAHELAKLLDNNNNKELWFDDLQIIPKEIEGTIPFVLNPTQEYYVNQLLAGKKSIKDIQGITHVIVKGRQVGMTTFLCALIFIRTFTSIAFHSKIMAYNKDVVEEIFEMVKRFWEVLPEKFKKGETLKRSTRKVLAWKKSGSSISVGSSGSFAVGRGVTIKMVLCTEVAYYKNGEAVITGIENTIPKTGCLWLESTSSGDSSYFYELWLSTKGKNAQRKGIFFSWTMHPEYTIPDDELNQYPELTEFQIEEASELGLTYNQQVWRLAKLEKMSLENFHKEFPLTAEEAFMASSNGVFNTLKINEQRDKVLPIGLDVIDLGLISKTDIWVWETPIVNQRYLMTVDIATGLDNNNDKDYSVIDMYNCSTFEQIFQVRVRVSVDLLSEMVAKLYKIYNNCLIVPEANNHGQGLIANLKNIYHIPTMNSQMSYGLYLHDDHYFADPNSKSEPKPMHLRQFGWPANIKTKVLAVQTLDKFINDGSIKFNSIVTLDELMAYSKLKSGKMGASGKYHDDTVTTAYIAATILAIKPRVMGSVAHHANENPYKSVASQTSFVAVSSHQPFNPNLPN